MLLGPLLGYITAARRASGNIAHSDSSDLWDESASIRADYRERLRYADEELRTLRIHVREIEVENRRIDVENRRLQDRVRDLEKYVTKLGGEINGHT